MKGNPVSDSHHRLFRIYSSSPEKVASINHSRIYTSVPRGTIGFDSSIEVISESGTFNNQNWTRPWIENYDPIPVNADRPTRWQQFTATTMYSDCCSSVGEGRSGAELRLATLFAGHLARSFPLD